MDSLHRRMIYTGIGSFHESNVESLILHPTTVVSPSEFIPLQSFSFTFGSVIHQKAFRLNPSWCFINQGAMGATLSETIRVKRLYEDAMESLPTCFFDRHFFPLLVHSLISLASFLHCRPMDLAPIPNATVGMQTAIQHVINKTGLVVATLDLIFNSVLAQVKQQCQLQKCSLTQIPLKQHLENSNLLKNDLILAEYIAEHLPPNCTVVVLDHITSSTALEIPIWKVIPMLKAKGVQSIVVDGAHAPLQCELAFNQLTKESLPTYYIGNLHKWISCPKTAAFLWSNPSVRQQTHSLIVSHGEGNGFLSEFSWTGTRDYTPFLTIPHALSFWTDHNLKEIRHYCSELLQSAETLLCSVLQTSKLPRGSPFMKLIRLPQALSPSFVSAKYIQDTLHALYRIEVGIVEINSNHYMRICCFVYNSLKDYQHLANALCQIMKQQRQKLN